MSMYDSISYCSFLFAHIITDDACTDRIPYVLSDGCAYRETSKT